MRVKQRIARSKELLSAGRLEEALKELDKAVGTDPFNAEVYSLMGEAYSQQERHREALDALVLATQFATPEQRSAVLARLADEYLVLGEDHSAARFLELLVTLDPRNAEAWSRLGRLAQQRGSHKEAVDCLEQALQHAPEDVVARKLRADSLAELRRYDEALADYALCEQADPTFSIARDAALALKQRLGRE